MYFENNDVQQIIDRQWQELKNKFKNINLDEYAIMPNHLHGIVVILDDGEKSVWTDVGADLCVCPGRTTTGAHTGAPLRQKPVLGTIIQWFKTMTTNYYIRGVKTKNWPKFNQRLWQRNYYEHIIRNGESLNRIRYYIKTNPDNWNTDRNNPQHT